MDLNGRVIDFFLKFSGIVLWDYIVDYENVFIYIG